MPSLQLNLYSFPPRGANEILQVIESGNEGTQSSYTTIQSLHELIIRVTIPHLLRVNRICVSYGPHYESCDTRLLTFSILI